MFKVETWTSKTTAYVMLAMTTGRSIDLPID